MPSPPQHKKVKRTKPTDNLSLLDDDRRTVVTDGRHLAYHQQGVRLDHLTATARRAMGFAHDAETS